MFVLDDPLALVVECAGRLVENQDAWIGDQRAGDRDALPLTAGQTVTTLADDGVVAFRQFQNKFMRAGKLGRGDHALDRHGRIGKRDIVADRSVEQHIFLQHDADLPPQPGGIDHREIDAVHEDAAALRHIEPLHQLRERALARAGRTDDPDDLARQILKLTSCRTSGPSTR